MDLHTVEHDVSPDLHDVVAFLELGAVRTAERLHQSQWEQDTSVSQALLHATLSGQHAPQLVI